LARRDPAYNVLHVVQAVFCGVLPDYIIIGLAPQARYAVLPASTGLLDTFSAPHFRDDEAARKLLETILWPEGPICPKCGVINHAYNTKKPGVFRCAEKDCRKDFTVTMNTVMERSHIALHKWLQAFHLMTSSKKGVSSHQLHRNSEVGGLYCLEVFADP
jgi:transposase-like protein